MCLSAGVERVSVNQINSQHNGQRVQKFSAILSDKPCSLSVCIIPICAHV